MTFLNEIIQVKKEEVKKLRRSCTLSSFRDAEFFNEPVRSLRKAIHCNNHLGLIAEIKKASPSKGALKQDFDHIELATVYMQNDVSAISILTDKVFFKGDLNFLRNISKFKTVPLLRKDFVIDEYQVFETKASGADAVLLIAEVLTKEQIKELTAAAKECGLDVLLEIHSENQLNKIDFNMNQLIGINNRNLDTFEVDLQTTLNLLHNFPGEVDIISESGFGSYRDIKMIHGTKVKAVLVGEHFMRADNMVESIKEFKEWCKYES